MQRFKGALVTGYWKDNPEGLVRDDAGDYVKYSDVKKLISECFEWQVNGAENTFFLSEDVLAEFNSIIKG